MIDRGRIGIRMCLFEGNEVDIKMPLHQMTVQNELQALWQPAAGKPGAII